MKPIKIWANLGVENIERTKSFYQQLGFKLNGTPTNELVSFFFSAEDFIIHFFKKEKLKRNLEGAIANLDHGNEIIFSLMIESEKEVDKLIEQIIEAGGTIRFDPRKDHKSFYDENGYYVCVFSDLDGHLFNLFCNLNI